MVIDNVIVNKSKIIERCIQRVNAEYQNNQLNLFDNITKQDSIVLNLQRACDATIDLAMRLIRKKKLGVPQTSREAFELLAEKSLISPELLISMKRMVGFRNIAVHQYQTLNIEIVKMIVENHLGDFGNFIDVVKSR